MSRRCFLLCSYGSEDFFHSGLLVTIESLRRTNPQVPIVVFSWNLDPSQRHLLRDCHMVDIDPVAFDTSHRPLLTEATYFKFHLERLREFDRIMWVDSDIVVLDDLADAFAIPGTIVAKTRVRPLAKEFRDVAQVTACERIVEGDPLLNGGLVCFDRKFWEREGLLEQALEVGRRYGWRNLINADQGILNILAYRYGGFSQLPAEYHYCRWRDMIDGDVLSLKRNEQGLFAPFFQGRFIRVLHWNGPTKPWEFARAGMSAADMERFYFACYQQFRGTA